MHLLRAKILCKSFVNSSLYIKFNVCTDSYTLFVKKLDFLKIKHSKIKLYVSKDQMYINRLEYFYEDQEL